MATILAICNKKGGVAKTTSTAAFADGLMRRGYSVLCVDLDPQPGNLSLTLGGDKDSVYGSYEVFTTRTGFQKPLEYIQNTSSCDLIAAHSALANVEGLLSTAPDRHLRLKPVLDALRGSYDYILIDTPPAFGILAQNALAAADEVIIPTQADYYSAHGVADLIKSIAEFSTISNPRLKIFGILITQYRAGTVLQSSVDEAILELAKHLGVKVFDTRISQTVTIQEAQQMKRRLSEYKPDSTGTKDYAAVIDEYLSERK